MVQDKIRLFAAAGLAVIIPSEAEDEEILLVADDLRILAYRIRPAGAIESSCGTSF